jgi:DNA-binding response OmpR family regulator
MAELGRILVADDEETFLQSTGDLLRREGYYCDCVPDAATAMEKLKNNNYDLLIADIKMPGNPDLELIRDMPSVANGMPAILVTGYPSQRSAIQAIQLPVVAYLVKPIDFDELLAQVETAIEKSRLYQAVVGTKRRLQYWQEGLADLEQVLAGRNGGEFSASVKSFLDLTFGNVAGALSDVKHVTDVMTSEDIDLAVCHLLNCPKLVELTDALEETIEVLEKTKDAFRSKELGRMRKKLQEVMKKTKKS